MRGESNLTPRLSLDFRLVDRLKRITHKQAKGLLSRVSVAVLELQKNNRTLMDDKLSSSYWCKLLRE